MSAAARIKEIEQLKREALIMRDQFAEFADRVFKIIEPDDSSSGDFKNGGLSDEAKAKMLMKRRKNVARTVYKPVK